MKIVLQIANLASQKWCLNLARSSKKPIRCTALKGNLSRVVKGLLGNQIGAFSFANLFLHLGAPFSLKETTLWDGMIAMANVEA